MSLKQDARLFIEQAKFISNGYYNSNTKSVLTLRKSGGHGIFWQLNWSQRPLYAWCKESSWLRWVEEKYPHDTLYSSDSKLLRLTSSWSWFNVSEELALTELDVVGEPVLACISEAWYPVLSLNRDDERLDFTLIDWPVEALKKFTQRWSALAKNKNQPCFRFPLLLGRMNMSRKQIRSATTGSVIIIPANEDIDKDYIWLQVAKKYYKIYCAEMDKYIVSDIKNVSAESEFYDTQELVSLDEIQLEVTFEVGYTRLSFSDIAELKAGSLLTSEVNFNTKVNLRVNGAVIAIGHIVMMGDTFGIRIEKITQEMEYE